MNIPEQMIAVEVTEPGGPEVLNLTQVSTPQVQADEVLVKVAVAGVNRPDCLQRQGLYPLPADASPLPGLEIAGEVVAIGAQVKRWAIGDKLVALTHGGGYAAYCRAHESHCLPWPDGCDALAAASLPETCFTVHYNLLTRAQLRQGESVLIHGGSSGIGSTAIQIAKAVGAHVYTTAGSEDKCRYCVELGADRAINYREEDWLECIETETGGRGVDVILDMVAGPYVEKNIQLLAPDGRYAMIAFLKGANVKVNFAQVLVKRLMLGGSTLRPQSVAQKGVIAAAVERDVWPWIAEGKVKTHIYRSFPLSQAADAHRLMESSEHMGKIMLTLED